MSDALIFPSPFKDPITCALKKNHVSNKENKEGAADADISGMMEEKEICELIHNLPEKLREQAETMLVQFAKKAKAVPFEKIAAGYTPFPADQNMTAENAITHLKSQLKPYLKAFGADEDQIYLDQLRKIEPLTNKIHEKLKYARKKDAEIPRLSEIVPKKTVRISKRRVEQAGEKLTAVLG